jgi:hypothetical protein
MPQIADWLEKLGMYAESSAEIPMGPRLAQVGALLCGLPHLADVLAVAAPAKPLAGTLEVTGTAESHAIDGLRIAGAAEFLHAAAEQRAFRRARCRGRKLSLRRSNCPQQRFDRIPLAHRRNAQDHIACRDRTYRSPEKVVHRPLNPKCPSISFSDGSATHRSARPRSTATWPVPEEGAFAERMWGYKIECKANRSRRPRGDVVRAIISAPSRSTSSPWR